MINDEKKLKPMQVVKASAGSGKTYELTYQYIKFLIGEKQKETGEYVLSSNAKRDAHRSILAMTFTNKATAEMKNRFMKELEKLSKYDSSQAGETYMERLCAEFGGESPEKIKNVSKKALEELLFFYSTFNVSTIDSFFQSILRSFAYDVGLDSDFQLEIKEDYLLLIAIHNFLMKLGMGDYSGTMVEKWVLALVRERIENHEGDWNFFQKSMNQEYNPLFDIAKELHSETARKYVVEIKNYFKELLEDLIVTKKNKSVSNANIQLFVNELSQKIKETNELVTKISDGFELLVKSCGRELENVSTKAGVSFFKKLRETGDICEKDTKRLLKGILNYTEDKIVKLFPSSKDKKWKIECENGEHNDVAQGIIELGKQAEVLLNDSLLLRGLKNDIYYFGLLGVILNEYDKLKREENIFVLSDTNTLIDGIVGGNDLSFIYERTGTKIENYLIDEFQDTSKMQYRNLLPLFKDSVDNKNSNLIIGDEKQSIYRFRNSDPTLLQTQLSADFGLEINIDNSNVTNWRSLPNVVKFNNTFFSLLANKLGAADVYGHTIQKLPGKDFKSQGYVKVTMFKEKDDQDKKQKLVDLSLLRLPELIKSVLARGYKQRDVAVLVNTNDEGASVVDCLLEYNRNVANDERIEVISNESLLLKNSVAVRLIIGHLQYINILNFSGAKTEKERKLREQKEQIFRVLCNYESAIADSTDSDKNKGDLLAQCFANDEKERRQTIMHYNDQVQEMRPKGSDTLSLISIVEKIIRTSINEDLLSTDSAFIYALQDFVSTFCSTNKNATVSAFLRYWMSKCDKLSISSPTDSNAVNVMTIHKSKGLEFPVVIIPFANWNLGAQSGNKKKYWVTREELLSHRIFKDFQPDIIPPVISLKESYLKDLKAEEISRFHSDMVVDCLNKTYVAFTRAANELYVFGVAKDKISEELVENDISNALITLLPTMNQQNADTIDAEFAKSTGLVAAQVGTAVACVEGEIADEQISNIYEVGSPLENFKGNKSEEKRAQMPKYFSREKIMNLAIPQVLNKQQDVGLKLHAFLHQIYRKCDCKRAMYFCKEQYRNDADMVAQAQRLVNKIKADGPVGEWFADENEVFNERSIENPQGGEKHNTRPDRVVRRPNGEIVVIDYKFAKESKSHANQVKAYCTLIAKAIPDACGVKGYLWYPFEDKIKPVFP